MWNELGAHITRFNPALADYLRPLGIRPGNPHALAIVAQQIAQQSAMSAMLDVFLVTARSFVVMLPLVLLLRKREGPATAPVVSE